jgi:hypothetical protein
LNRESPEQRDGMPPGKENWVNRRFMPSSSGEMFG